MKCPHCGSEEVKKGGRLNSGKQRYYCKICGKSFSSSEPVVKIIKECMYCHGTNTVKSGRTKHNAQVWLCNDCKRKFNENSLPVETIEQPCPYCGGELKFKGWSNTGHKRRYICSVCKKGFSGDLNNLQVKIIEKPCPYCGSEDVKRGGKLRSGVQRYTCNTCGRGFNKNTVIDTEPLPEKCPKCGQDSIRKSGKDTKTGKQRYLCRSCGYKFVKNPSQQTFKVWQKECPTCGHIGAKKGGKSSGKQYYICLECGHKYLENGLYTHFTEKQKQSLRKMFIAGWDKDRIAEYFGKTPRTINVYMAKMTEEDIQAREHAKMNIIDKQIAQGASLTNLCHKYNLSKETIDKRAQTVLASETVSSEQKELILKFGVECAVPVPYLAPYVKCSERMCEKIISKYPRVGRKKFVLSEKDRAFDKMELDKFV